MWRKRQKDKEKKKKIKKKRLGLKLKLMLLLGSLPTMMIIVIVLGSSILLFSLTSLLAGTLWDNFADDPIEEEHGELCECGCIWVADGINGEEVVEVEDVSSGSGVDVSSLKYLGTLQMSYYTFEDNDDGHGNFGTDATSTGASATKNITIALTPKDAKNLGLEYGDWVYIENIGVRQFQDFCGTAGRVDVYVGHEGEQPEIEAYSLQMLKIYMVKEGTMDDIQKGSQDGVQIPQVTSTTTQVPSYGHATGSITNTSSSSGLQIPEYTDAQTKALVDAILPGATVISQYYNINICFTLGKQPSESSWDMVTNSSYAVSKGYNLFNVQKDNEFTGERVETGRWCKYSSYEEAIIDYGRNFHKSKGTYSGSYDFIYGIQNKSYADVLNAYSSGYEEQARIVAYTGYCYHEESLSSVTESTVRNAAETYANNIIDVGARAKELNNIDVAMAYMEKNGLMDRYNEALGWMKKYEEKGPAFANTNPNGGSVDVGNSNGSSGSGKGHWVCACERPCKNCGCHDTETEGDGQNGAGSSAVFPEAVAGQASGLWGTTQQLVGYIAALNSMNMPNGVTNIDRLRENLNNLVGYMGMEPADPYHYEYDKFTGSDGWGFVHYRQGLSSLEPFNKKPYNDGSGKATFSSSGCGLYATAMALSTLEKKWVSPAEVAIALQTYGVRNGVRINTTLMGSSGAAYINGLHSLIVEAGYTDAKLDTNNGLVQSEIDNCLDKGGLIIYVTNDPNLTGGGHYVVIRDRTNSGMYLLGDSVKQNNNEFTFNRLKQYDKNGAAIYIYPKAGESIFDRLSGNNDNGSSSGSGIVSDIRQSIVDTAMKYIGVPYLWGGSTPSGFDCSGLTSYVYKELGYSIPRTSKEQYKSLVHIDYDDLKPGDLIFFTTDGSGGVSHVGLYIGNDQMIHAPGTGKYVCIAPTNDDYRQKTYVGGGRVIND